MRFREANYILLRCFFQHHHHHLRQKDVALIFHRSISIPILREISPIHFHPTTDGIGRDLLHSHALTHLGDLYTVIMKGREK